MSPAQNTIEHGLLLEEKMEWETAVEVYTALLAGAAGADAELAFRLGHAHFHLGQFDQAATHLQTATATDPGESPRFILDDDHGVVVSWSPRLSDCGERSGRIESGVRSVGRRDVQKSAEGYHSRKDSGSSNLHRLPQLHAL